MNSLLLLLRVLAGTWLVTRSGAPAGQKPEQLVNTCSAVGQYYACQQAVNGKVSTLLVFMPAGKPGHFYTQNIRPEGVASGRADLEIDGDRWTYLNTRTDQGRTTYYRNINIFKGANHIHFEQSESTDNTNWKVTGSGDEVRSGMK